MIRRVVSTGFGVAGFVCIFLSLGNVALAVPLLAPEIDGASAMGALSVLGAGLMMLRDRLK